MKSQWIFTKCETLTQLQSDAQISTLPFAASSKHKYGRTSKHNENFRHFHIVFVNRSMVFHLFLIFYLHNELKLESFKYLLLQSRLCLFLSRTCNTFHIFLSCSILFVLSSPIVLWLFLKLRNSESKVWRFLVWWCAVSSTTSCSIEQGTLNARSNGSAYKTRGEHFIVAF